MINCRRNHKGRWLSKTFLNNDYVFNVIIHNIIHIIVHWMLYFIIGCTMKNNYILKNIHNYKII